MRELLYYFTFEETQMVGHGLYIIGIIIAIILVLRIRKHTPAFNMICLPIIFFCFLIGYFFQQMPIKLLNDIAIGYNLSTSDIDNKNPDRHKIIQFKIVKGDVMITEYHKDYVCAHKKPGTIDWLHKKKCVTKTINQKYECNIIDVNACVAIIYEKYLF